MLNLNAMFGSCESIFDQPVRTRKVSSTDFQMMEMEIITDLARAEVDTARISSTNMQLDQLLNMYNHVKRFGIDRTFLSLYNTNGQLNNMLGVKFPSCESINAVGNVNSNMSRAFIVAMEDEKEGIFSKIIKGIKWVWEKIKYICSVVWDKLKSWIGLSTKRNKAILDKSKEAVKNGAKPKSIKRIITKKRVAAALAVVGAAIAAIQYHKKKIESAVNAAKSEEYKRGLAERDKLTKEHEDEINFYQGQLDARQKTINDRDKTIAERDATIIKRQKIINDRDKTIAERNAYITQLDDKIKELEKIKQEEKPAVITNPNSQQVLEVINNTQDANAELGNATEDINEMIKTLQQELEHHHNEVDRLSENGRLLKIERQEAVTALNALKKSLSTTKEATDDVNKQMAELKAKIVECDSKRDEISSEMITHTVKSLSTLNRIDELKSERDSGDN